MPGPRSTTRTINLPPPTSRPPPPPPPPPRPPPPPPPPPHTPAHVSNSTHPPACAAAADTTHGSRAHRNRVPTAVAPRVLEHVDDRPLQLRGVRQDQRQLAIQRQRPLSVRAS